MTLVKIHLVMQYHSFSSQTIIVCNAGLVNGVAREVIVELFSTFGPLKHVLMVEGKSFCFVQFHSVACAEVAFSSVQGRLTLPQTNGTLYLLYCETCEYSELQYVSPFKYCVRNKSLAIRFFFFIHGGKN